MQISKTRQNALIALGKREAETGQKPGSGGGPDAFWYFAGRYNAQLEWAADQGLVNRELCVYERRMATLTADGGYTLKPAFSLTEKGVEAAVLGSVEGKKVSQAKRNATFGKTTVRPK